MAQDRGRKNRTLTYNDLTSPELKHGRQDTAAASPANQRVLRTFSAWSRRGPGVASFIYRESSRSISVVFPLRQSILPSIKCNSGSCFGFCTSRKAALSASSSRSASNKYTTTDCVGG